MKDADILLRWRNDPQTRKSSKNSDLIPMKQHVKWLMSSLKDKNRKIHIAERGRVPVGTIRTDYLNGVNELSWTIAPEARGRGIGKEMVALFVKQIDTPIRAEIKIDNDTSKHIAEYADIDLFREENGMLYYQRPATFGSKKN